MNLPDVQMICVGVCEIFGYSMRLKKDGGGGVSILGALEITIEIFVTVAVETGEPLSATEIEKILVPDVVGVPEITPVDASRLTPSGRVPDEIEVVREPSPFCE
jgi:hypothetical protein